MADPGEGEMSHFLWSAGIIFVVFNIHSQAFKSRSPPGSATGMYVCKLHLCSKTPLKGKSHVRVGFTNISYWELGLPVVLATFRVFHIHPQSVITVNSRFANTLLLRTLATTDKFLRSRRGEIYRGLTGNDSRYYGLSLFKELRTLLVVPKEQFYCFDSP